VPAGLDVGATVGLALGVGADVVGAVVAVGVADVEDVGVGVALVDDVGVPLVAVAACVLGVKTADWDVGVVGRFVGVGDGVLVGGRVASPARDAVEVTPTLGVAPFECVASSTATTATTTAAAAAAGQRHRRNGDGGRTGGMPPVPPATSRPAAVTAPDAGMKAVCGSRPCSTRVAATGSASAAAGTTAPSSVGS
jgi:hypothetical protein